MRSQVANPKNVWCQLTVLALTLGITLFATVSWAVDMDSPVVKPEMITGEVEFEVTLTNLTEGAPGEAGQIFSPVLMVTHNEKVKLLEVGTPASDELRILAEEGNNAPLAELASILNGVAYVVAKDNPLPPAASVTVMIEGDAEGWLLSLAAKPMMA